MNKAELIEAVAGELGCSKAGAERAVNAVLGGIAHGLKRDREVGLVGFGSFQVRYRGPRSGTNPRSGKPIHIKGSNRVAFHAGKDLKAQL
jgi:DNA-binding protein HU-beta